jgi:threonine/homoserine/homoserine lactone efflux protein
MIQLLGTFFIISLTGALSPGPLTTVAIVEGSRRGKWSGVRLAVGHGLVEIVYVAAIALVIWFGRQALLEQPLVIGSIAVVGGLFLVWMGWGMGYGAWRHRLTLEGSTDVDSKLGLVSTGSVVTLSNPYWWVWWALITPLYIEQALAWGVLGLLVLFVVHWSSDLGWLTLLAWLTGSGKSLFSARVYRVVLIVCGAALLFFGITFVIAGIGFLITGEVSLG